MATRLFVGNLPESTEEHVLLAAFSSFGEIKNLELKSKSATGDESKKFAFVTISGSNYNIESCIKHFSNEDFNGNRLYVTRARESFLERLQRERQEAQHKATEKIETPKAPKKTPEIKLGDKLNPRKRKIENDTRKNHKHIEESRPFTNESDVQNVQRMDTQHTVNGTAANKKKQDSEMKRMEAMKKRRQEFREKQQILKSGLTGVDKTPNKKVIFSDNEEDSPKQVNGEAKNTVKADKKKSLFNEDDENEDSSDELNFKIKEQFEGKKGQKVLDLQSRYKSDKRFVLDERFIEDDEGECRKDQEAGEDDQVEVNQTDEKAKQLNILQDVLGVEIKRKNYDEDRDGKKKPKIGMLRFDPLQPEHAKFLAPVEVKKQESTKKSKKKTKEKQVEETQEEAKPEEPRPEVSKEQFYKVSETLKEAIAQPTSFSLRSLFGNNNVADKEPKEEEGNYIPLEASKKSKSKVKNPLEPGEKNPFVYDSSDSEDEVEKESRTDAETPAVSESKAVWKESLFFQQSDQRLEEGLAFFTNTNNTDVRKERRELKSLMKKRIYNKERKDQMQMFKKKIGGRKKTMKKSFRRKN